MELADDVRREQPRYFVVASSAPQPWLVGNDASADQQLLEYPNSSLLADDREVEEFVFHVYERNEGVTDDPVTRSRGRPVLEVTPTFPAR
jgi:hypothetical protein